MASIKTALVILAVWLLGITISLGILFDKNIELQKGIREIREIREQEEISQQVSAEAMDYVSKIAKEYQKHIHREHKK